MKKTALLFPGQGSQYPGMGSLIKEQKSAALVFEEASDILKYDTLKLCLESHSVQTDCIQPIVYILSVAFFEVFRKDFPIPQFMAGHSLGEFTALTCAGAMKFSDAVSIIELRSKLMQDAALSSDQCMSAINGLDLEQVLGMCQEVSTDYRVVSVAAYNSPSQVVISGSTPGVSIIEDRCRNLKANVIRLKINCACHSSLMSEASKELKLKLAAVKFNTPNCRVISNVSGVPYSDSTSIIENLTRQMYSPVLWTSTIAYLMNSGAYYFLELGPGKVLRNLLKNIPNIESFSLDTEGDSIKLKESISSNIQSVFTPVTKCLSTSMTIRNSNWDNDEYEKGVIIPFRAMKDIQSRLELNHHLPGEDDIHKAIDLLSQILDTKKVKPSHKHQKIKDVLLDSGVANII